MNFNFYDLVRYISTSLKEKDKKKLLHKKYYYQKIQIIFKILKEALKRNNNTYYFVSYNYNKKENAIAMIENLKTWLKKLGFNVYTQYSDIIYCACTIHISWERKEDEV